MALDNFVFFSHLFAKLVVVVDRVQLELQLCAQLPCEIKHSVCECVYVCVCARTCTAISKSGWQHT